MKVVDVNELPEPWRTAGEQKGLSSYRAIARASGAAVETVRMIISGKRRPSPATASKLAEAFGVPAAQIDAWSGIGAGGVHEPYYPPAAASRLTIRQRKALDEMIRAMTEHVPDNSKLHGLPENYDLAALKGHNEGRRLKAEADALGEESQDHD